jgi:hypothetical protein
MLGDFRESAAKGCPRHKPEIPFVSKDNRMDRAQAYFLDKAVLASGEGWGSMDGSESNRLTLSPRGRGWPDAGAFTSRGGPGEGVRNTLPNL